MSNTEEKTNENDETLEKVAVEQEDDQLLKNESGQETDPNLQNDNQVADDENELNLEDLVRERDELKDKLMRSLAESENIRKRSLKDRQDAEVYAVTKMSRDILSVYDNLQRALDLAEDILDEKTATDKILADSRFVGGASGVTTLINLKNEFNISGEINSDEVALKAIEAQKRGLNVIL